MLDVLILSEPYDIHAFAVYRAIVKKGGSAQIVFTSDFPTKSNGSIAVGSDDLDIYGSALGTLDSIRDLKIGALWWRRPQEPMVSTELDPEDQVYALQQSKEFLRALLFLLSDRATLNVNDPQSIARANSKPLQLIAAQEFGFKIPSTLFSNDDSRIRDFVRDARGELVHKSFSPFGWKDAQTGIGRYAFTSRFALGDLETGDVSSCPGIFQQFIGGEEIRAAVVGEEVFAVAVSFSGEVDSRKDLRRRHVPLQTMLTVEEERQIAALVHRFGLHFATLDLIRAETGELYFLELNESGQWIFMEREVPHLGLLNTFADYLLSAGRSYKSEVVVMANDIINEIVKDREFLEQYAST